MNLGREHKDSDDGNFLPVDFGQNLRPGEMECDITGTVPAAEDVSNKRFCCCCSGQFFKPCSEAHPLRKA